MVWDKVKNEPVKFRVEFRQAMQSPSHQCGTEDENKGQFLPSEAHLSGATMVPGPAGGPGHPCSSPYRWSCSMHNTWEECHSHNGTQTSPGTLNVSSCSLPWSDALHSQAYRHN